VIEALRHLTPADLCAVREALESLEGPAALRAQMAREGLIRPARGKLPPHTPAAIKVDPPVSQTIVEERR
jgi:hypothetical protein